ASLCRFFFFSSRRRHTRFKCDWSSDVCSSDLAAYAIWFFLGLAGGHRFYLRRPITGAVQALLFLSCIGAVAIFQYYQAFAGLASSEERRVGKDCDERGARQDGCAVVRRRSECR